jgi:hypothetical protein
VALLRSEKAIELLLGGLGLGCMPGFDWEWIIEVVGVVGYSFTKMKVIRLLGGLVGGGQGAKKGWRGEVVDGLVFEQERIDAGKVFEEIFKGAKK